MSLTKTINVPNSKEEREYDGSIPANLDIQDEKIHYTIEQVDAAFDAGEIDDVNREYLLNILAEHKYNPGIINTILNYRDRIANNMKPGQELFIKMQEIGFKHHINLGKLGLDISGYNLPMVDLSGGIVNGVFRMRHTEVRSNIKIIDARFLNDVDFSQIKAWCNVQLSRTKINGNLNLYKAIIEGNIDISEVDIPFGSVNLGKSVIWGAVQKKGINTYHGISEEGAKIYK